MEKRVFKIKCIFLKNPGRGAHMTARTWRRECVGNCWNHPTNLFSKFTMLLGLKTRHEYYVLLQFHSLLIR